MTAGNLNLTNSGTGGITGIIANASEVDTLALIKAGAGTLTLSANNTFTGDTTITTGTLTVTGTLADTTDVSVASGATYKLEVSDTIGSISGQGTVSVGDDFSFDAVVLTVDHSTAKTFSGNLIIPIGMEAHGFVKLGSGTLTFTTANTDADGDITVTGGVLSITHNEALGNTTTTVNSGAALHLSNNITVDAGIRLNGSGVSNNGALRSVSGSNTLTQWLLLETDTEIQVDSGSSLAISPTDHYSSAITGTYVGNNRHLTLDAQGTLGISKNINIGGKNLTKTGSGTLTLSATNTYTGDTTISAGTLKLTGNLNSATDLVIDTGATLDLQAALTAATLTLNGTISNTANTSSLTISGTSNLGGDVTTTGTQTYQGAVTLSAATVTLTTTDSNITFNGTIDSDGVSARALTLNLNGADAESITADVIFGNATADTLGATNPLGAISITGDLDLNAAITSAASLSVSGTTNLGANVTTRYTNLYRCGDLKCSHSNTDYHQ